MLTSRPRLRGLRRLVKPFPLNSGTSLLAGCWFHNRDRSTLGVLDAQKKTNGRHRSNEDATRRKRLDSADTSAALDADGRSAREDAATEKGADQDGGNPLREGKNNATEFLAKAARSPEALKG